MNISLENAIEIAEKYLNEAVKDRVVFNDCQFVVERNLIKELNDYWIFYYQTDKFLETNDLSRALVGNIPLKVSKTNGEILGFEKK
jgi:hypothetical protein